MKRRALSWFMAAALGVGTMAGGIGSANIVLAEEQNEETEAADETSEEPAEETDSDSSVMKIGALKGPTAMVISFPFLRFSCCIGVSSIPPSFWGI